MLCTQNETEEARMQCCCVQQESWWALCDLKDCLSGPYLTIHKDYALLAEPACEICNTPGSARSKVHGVSIIVYSNSDFIYYHKNGEVQTRVQSCASVVQSTTHALRIAQGQIIVDIFL